MVAGLVAVTVMEPTAEVALMLMLCCAARSPACHHTVGSLWAPPAAQFPPSHHPRPLCRLEGEVAALEAHLDGIKAAYACNADKLDYNYRVLGALWLPLDSPAAGLRLRLCSMLMVSMREAAPYAIHGCSGHCILLRLHSLPSAHPPRRTAVEREKESKEALAQQKRKIMRQWEVLNRLKKRWVPPWAWCRVAAAGVLDG